MRSDMSWSMRKLGVMLDMGLRAPLEMSGGIILAEESGRIGKVEYTAIIICF